MIGIDEVGRGAWAGPLLVLAARQVGDLSPLLRDSKVLTKKRREALLYDIELSCDIGQGWVQAQEIDQLGLTEAMRLGVSRALAELNAKPDEEIIIDGHINYCPTSYIAARCVIKADATHPIVSAASVYAKVLRDRYMVEIASKYPAYGFERHVGYGTKYHMHALAQFGACAIHRRSYAPLRSLVNDN